MHCATCTTHQNTEETLCLPYKNKASIIQQKFLKHSHTEDGMQPCCASTDINLKSLVLHMSNA